ncbi:MAG: hypothetical protein P8Y71_05480 [Pseudolabrys sp.]
MAALLGDKIAQDNGIDWTLAETEGMHPALYCWREQLPAAIVRMLAYLGGIALLSIAAAQIFQAPAPMDAPAPANQPQWNEVKRPFPAFALSIPEAAGVPSHYAVRYNRNGVGRKDVLSLGEPDAAAPYLRVEVYRPGDEIGRFAEPVVTIVGAAAALRPDHVARGAPLASKFGPLSTVTFDTSKGAHCLGLVRSFDDPRLQLSGWFCRGGDFVRRSTLACALDRLTLLSAGSEPKVGALFAKAELKRSFCAERDPIIAATPKYKVLWKALATRPQPRRIGP